MYHSISDVNVLRSLLHDLVPSKFCLSTYYSVGFDCLPKELVYKIINICKLKRAAPKSIVSWYIFKNEADVRVHFVGDPSYDDQSREFLKNVG